MLVLPRGRERLGVGGIGEQLPVEQPVLQPAREALGATTFPRRPQARCTTHPPWPSQDTDASVGR